MSPRRAERVVMEKSDVRFKVFVPQLFAACIQLWWLNQPDDVEKPFAFNERLKVFISHFFNRHRQEPWWSTSVISLKIFQGKTNQRHFQSPLLSETRRDLSTKQQSLKLISINGNCNYCLGGAITT